MTAAAAHDLAAFRQHFDRAFGTGEAPRAFFAPGRVNLIGDHTDATGGLVFPCAIGEGTRLLIRRNRARRYRFASTDFELTADLAADDMDTPRKAWIDYPLGVIDRFRQRGVDIDGVDLLLSGSIPHGAGLSSSASVEVVVAYALNALFDAGLNPVELALLAQRAENDFVGMRCGIMDQFAVAMAEAGHALQLNCSTLEHRQVPLALGEHALLVANTHQRRELADSGYNDRVDDCTRATAILVEALAPQRGDKPRQLADVSVEALASVEARFAHDPRALKRARHVTSENARVREAVPALEAGDLAAFGALMNASHDSLARDYEVSSEPLDTLVGLARAQPGTLGSRLTGAGFGGCTVTLLPERAIERFIDEVGPRYRASTGLTAEFLRIRPGRGAHELDASSGAALDG